MQCWIWNHTSDFFIFHNIKILLVHLELWMDLWPVCDFVTSCIGHLKNNGLLSYTDLSNIDTFDYTIFNKSHSLIWPLFSSKKPLRIGKWSRFCCWVQVFQNSNFESSNFIIGNRYCQFFSLKCQAHFIHFRENLCQIPQSE